MSKTELRQQLERVSEPEERKTIRSLIDRMEPELVKSLQDPGAAQRLARHYLTAIRLNPALYECTSESLLAALLLSAQVGLDPGPLGHVYLVPYKTECTWILGYTGIVELARRTERCADLMAEVVWDCDAYTRPWKDERGVHYRFEPGPEEERKERLAVLVTWRERAAGKWTPRAVEVPRSRVERAKRASPAYRKQSGPWVTDETAMWAKTGIRAVRPWLPLSPEAGYALSMDDSRLATVEADEDGAAQPVAVDKPGEVVDNDG